MRRRVLQATITAVVVSLILLGLPLGIIGGGLVRSNELREIENRAVALSRSIDGRISRGEAITEDLLELYSNSGNGLTARVTVITPLGETLAVGPQMPGQVEVISTPTSQNAIVRLEVSSSDLVWKSIQAVALVGLAGLVALGAGIITAIWQANRLTAPLVYLAASAEQLGSGQVRPHLKPSGVEEIDLVTEELSRSADRLAARLAVERQFAADASHQLRTPLTALSMRLEEIIMLAATDEVRDEARVSLEQVERLVAVVDDLLARSRQNSGGTTERIQLLEVVEQQYDEWQPSFEAANRTLQVHVEPDVHVLATPGALAQVLATLIENSLKHGDGTTSLTTRPSGTRGSIAIDIADQGTGVPADLAPNIFEREVTSGNGTGLGLALARDLVTSDGGRLELSQRTPAVFTVFLSGVPRTMDPNAVIPHGEVIDPVTRSGWGRRGNFK